jgi:hypothetical protein
MSDTRNNQDNEDNNEGHFNMNDDIETMNNAIKNNNTNSKKICLVDKNVLKTLILEWLALDDNIKSYRDTIKDMTEEKKQYESQILDLMNTLKQETILTDKGNITRNIKTSKGALTPELIKTTLTDILKCSDTADTYTNQILEKRVPKESINLKRQEIKTKKVKQLKKNIFKK